MDCEKAAHRMYHYLDGELWVWRRWKVSRHLNRCSPCAQGFVYEVEFRQVIAMRCRDNTPPALRRRIADAIGSEPNEQPDEAAR